MPVKNIFVLLAFLVVVVLANLTVQSLAQDHFPNETVGLCGVRLRVSAGSPMFHGRGYVEGQFVLIRSARVQGVTWWEVAEVSEEAGGSRGWVSQLDLSRTCPLYSSSEISSEGVIDVPTEKSLTPFQVAQQVIDWIFSMMYVLFGVASAIVFFLLLMFPEMWGESMPIDNRSSYKYNKVLKEFFGRVFHPVVKIINPPPEINYQPARGQSTVVDVIPTDDPDVFKIVTKTNPNLPPISEAEEKRELAGVTDPMLRAVIKGQIDRINNEWKTANARR